MGRPNPSRETKFSSVNGDSEILIFPVQLTTSRIDNPTRLIHTAVSDDHAFILSRVRRLRIISPQGGTEKISFSLFD